MQGSEEVRQPGLFARGLRAALRRFRRRAAGCAYAAALWTTLAFAAAPAAAQDPTITISGGSAVTEGTAAQFTVTANPAPTANLTVNLTVSESSDSDYVTAGERGFTDGHDQRQQHHGLL